MLRQSEIGQGALDQSVPDDIRELAYRIINDVIALAARVNNSNRCCLMAQYDELVTATTRILNNVSGVGYPNP